MLNQNISEKMEVRLFLQYLDREVTSLGFALWSFEKEKEIFENLID